MMHIGLEPGQVGRYVFLSGNSELTEKIVAYFDNQKEVAYNREFHTFVGELDGATSTSMECSVLFYVSASFGIRTGFVMVSATNFHDYSENGRKNDIDYLETEQSAPPLRL